MKDDTDRWALGWLSGVRAIHKLDSGKWLVGEPGRVMFVGQAPARGREMEPALGGRSGDKLRAILGCSVAEFRERFDCMNVLPYYPGKAGKGDMFPLRQAKVAAGCVVHASKHVVLLGLAAKAYGLERAFDTRQLGPATWAVAYPHPSGVSRWWNDQANTIFATNFLRCLVDELGSA
jgi:uracil-DNA glycosylase